MILLFDQNISPKIIKKLQENYPKAQHIRKLGLEDASDIILFNYAKQNDFAIVPFDSDFADISIMNAIYPKKNLAKNR